MNQGELNQGELNQGEMNQGYLNESRRMLASCLSENLDTLKSASPTQY